MSQQTTIRKLADLVNTPVDKLLEQLAEAGMSFDGPDQVVTSTEKVKLLGFLRRAHGKADQAAAEAAAPKKITLNRKKVQELTVGGGRTRSTVAVEVRQKRTYVKPTEAETAIPAGTDPERAEILRKLEESRQRNLEEQQQLAEADRKRNEEAIAAQRRAAEENLEEHQPAEDLLSLEGMDEATAYVLASRGVRTRDDLADLAVDEITDIEDMDAERAAALIMEARRHCFE